MVSTVKTPIQPGKIKFDPTINLGHILTFAGFITTGFVTYNQVDKRITVLEESTKSIQAVNHRQVEDIKEVKSNVREDLRDINKKLDNILITVERK